MKAIRSFETSGTAHRMTQHHNPEDSNPQNGSYHHVTYCVAYLSAFFYVLLIVHLSIILDSDQLDTHLT